MYIVDDVQYTKGHIRDKYKGLTHKMTYYVMHRT
jgi:hypothetical protein